VNCIDESTKVRFFTLNMKSASKEGTASGVEVDEDGIRLAQHFDYDIAKRISEQELGQELGGNVKVVDFAIGACNLLYVLAVLDQRKAMICTYDLMQDLFEQLEGIESLLESPTSIALAPGRLYIANREGEKRIIALAWPARETEWYVRADGQLVYERKISPVEGPKLGLKEFMPIDLVADSTGVLFALDEKGRVIVKINADGTSVATFGDTALSRASALALYDPALRKATPTAVAPDDSFLCVLDETSKSVLKFTVAGKLDKADLIDFQALVKTPQADRLSSDFIPAGLAVDDKGRIYIGDGQVSPSEGVEDDRFLHKFDAAGHYLTPVAGFRGSARLIVVDRTGKMVLLTQQATEQQQIIVLKPKEPKESKTKSSSVARGDYVSKAFDSTAAGTQWHKLALEATIPPNAQLLVAHYVAEDKLLPDDPAWSEPIQFSPGVLDEIDGRLQLSALIRESEAHSARGRYLWLKLTLIGGEQGTPEVKSVHIYFPRLSYLRYLPAIYQQDAKGRDFLERFLSLFETFLADIEQKIDDITRYFDVDGVADEFLVWLAGWLAIAADEDWKNEQIRRLMKQAPTLFRRRGTRAGIEEMVKVFTDDYPFILEQFQIPLPSAEAEEDYLEQLNHLKQLYQSYPDPYYFYVFLKPNQAQREPERTVVRRLIEAEKPAHTRVCILDLEPWVFLDGHTYLGVNTYLSEPPARLDMGALLGDTRLTEPINRQRQGSNACSE
jgi:phage tail-like protein